MNLRHALLLCAFPLAACSSDPAPAADAGTDTTPVTDGSSSDASASDASSSDASTSDASTSDASTSDASSSDVSSSDASVSDASTPTLRRCATTGRGGIAGDVCFNLTPIESGLNATGANADVDQYALRPTSNARGTLLIYLNGSGGSPRGAVISPDTNVYATARAQGLHVLAVSYRSDDAVAQLCATSVGAARDTCFLATRTSIVTGVAQPGAAAAVQSIALHEGVYARVGAALVALNVRDPEGRWNQFYDASAGRDVARALRWSSIMVAGLSQGGGHAALLARLHPVQRAVMFSSPCDATALGEPSAWLTWSASAWQTPSANLRGFGSSRDTLCTTHVAAWDAMALPAANRADDAVVCTGETGHGAPIACADNAARWASLFAP